MTLHLCTAFMIHFFLAGDLLAQLVPETNQNPNICPDRPVEPDIIANMDVRDSHKRILVQRMYRASAFQNVVDTNFCSCDNRFPAWDIAVNYYLEHYSGIEDQWEIQQVTGTYRSSIGANRAKVREICKAQGNWD